MRPSYTFLVLLLGAVLISWGASFWFEFEFLALFTGLVALVKKLKLFALVEWAIKVGLLKLPRRFITRLILRLFGDYLIIAWLKIQFLKLRGWWGQSQLKIWAGRQYERWKNRPVFRLTVTSLFALLIAVSTASLGIVIFLIFGLDEIAEIFRRFIWPTLSETAFVQALGRMYQKLKSTRFGRWLIAVDAWVENQIEGRIDRLRAEYAALVLEHFEETLTYQLKTQPQQPLTRIRHHEHLTESSIRKFRPDAQKDIRRDQTRPPPRPR